MHQLAIHELELLSVHASKNCNMRSLHASTENFQMLAQRFDFSRYQSLGDFGGSLGCLAVCVAQQHAGMTCTTYDLPPVHDGAVEYVQKAGLQGRVKVGKQW
jgi:hypothetical protein